MLIVRGPRKLKEQLIEQAARHFPEEVARDGLLFMPEDVITGTDEQVEAAMLAIHRQINDQLAERRRQREQDPLARMRRDAWRKAGL